MNSDPRPPDALSTLLADLRQLGRPGVRFATALGPIPEGADAVRVAWERCADPGIVVQVVEWMDARRFLDKVYELRPVETWKTRGQDVLVDPIWKTADEARASFPLDDAAVARLWGRQP